jgi:DNA-binding transcriptional MerR regulator
MRVKGCSVAVVSSSSASYSSAEVCRLAGVSYRRLDYWARLGLVAPSVCECAGSGTRRRWSPADVLRVKRVAVAARLTHCRLVDALDMLAELEAELAGLAVLEAELATLTVVEHVA